jgi:hypothetical protein
MQIKLDHTSRNMAITTLSIVLPILLASLSYAFYRSRKLSPLLVIGGYQALLVGLFMVGLLEAYGYGWGFFPLVIATMPSYFVVALLPNSSSHWFASGLLGNFVLLVVLCGGMNSLAFYLIAMAIRYSPYPPGRQGGQPELR